MEEHTSQAEPHGLEPQQYERLYWEEDIPVRDITKGIKGTLFLVGCLLFIAIIVVSAVVKFPDQLELPFVLKSQEQEDVYKFPFTIYIDEMLVQAGQKVEAGQPLVKVTSPEIVQMISELRQQTANQDNFESYGTQSFSKQRGVFSNEVIQQQLRLAQLTNDLDLVDRQWQSRYKTLSAARDEAKTLSNTADTLYKEGVVSRQDAVAAENNYLKALDEIISQEAEVKRQKFDIQTRMDALRQSIASLMLAQSKLHVDQQADSSEINNSLRLAEDYISSIFNSYSIEEGSLIIHSPREAVISFAFEGERELTAGSTLIKLTKNNTPDYAFIKCPPSSMGRLDTGMDVHLKVSSFPYYEWGTASGKVHYASLTPDEKGQYNVHVSLNKLGRLEGHLFNGLTGSAVIVLEERSLLQYFFVQLSKKYHQVVKGDT